MAVARGVLLGTPLGLYTTISTALCANSALRYRSYATAQARNPKPGKDRYNRLRMASTRDWYYPDGTIQTTVPNQKFVQAHNLCLDNGKSYRLREPKDASQVLSEHGIQPHFHTQHLVHPFRLDFLDPRGHPLAEMKRTELLEKHQTQALWSNTTCLAKNIKAIVRTRAARRVRASLISGLERAGYDQYGIGQGKQLYGTAVYTVIDLMKYINMPPSEKVGDAMVKLIEAETNKKPPAASRGNNNWDSDGPSKPIRRELKPDPKPKVQSHRPKGLGTDRGRGRGKPSGDTFGDAFQSRK